MRGAASAFCSVRSAVVLALFLVSTFVVLDSYTFHLLSVPWPSSKVIDVESALHQHARLVSPEEAEAAIAAANKEWQRSGDVEAEEPNTFPQEASQVNTTSAAEAPGSSIQGTAESTNAKLNATNIEKPNGSAQEVTEGSPETQSSATNATTPKTESIKLTGLQKLENGLKLARAAIRNGVRSGLEKDGNLAPEVYRNATVFQRSYREMEKRFKLFSYPEGEEPLVHNGPCKEIYAIEGRFIQELQGKNGYLTKDPEEAHVFFLPFSVAMMVTYLYTPGSGDRGPLATFTKDYVEVIRNRYPFWDRSKGADHFMLSCHDWGPHVSRSHPELMSNSIRVLCNANTSEGYMPNKDASLPEIHLVGGESPKQLGGPPPEERRYLAFFAGGDHGPVRPVLFKYWKEKDDDVRVFERLPSREAYQDYMRHSKYCLCPGGYEVNSPRIVEAIYYDCVPVIIADDFVLPFSDVLDWDAFSVKILEKDIPNVKTILQAIPNERYLEMHARIPKVRKHFEFNQPPQRYDVFSMILHSVWLRRLNMILHE